MSAGKSSKDCSCDVLVPFRFSLVGIAQQFELNWLVVQCVLAQKSDHLIEAISGWSVLMEQVTGKENKVNLVFPCQRSFQYSPTWTLASGQFRTHNDRRTQPAPQANLYSRRA